MKKIRIGSGWILPAIMALSGLCSCDDIYRPLQDAYLPKNVSPQTPAIEKKPLTRMEMEKLFIYILNIRENLRRRGEGVFKVKETDPEKFERNRKRFHDQMRNWDEMVKGRLKKLETFGKDYPPGHPAPLLRQSLHLLLQEMYNYDRHFYGYDPYDPGIDQKLLDELSRARELLDLYHESPLEEAPGPPEE